MSAFFMFYENLAFYYLILLASANGSLKAG